METRLCLARSGFMDPDTAGVVFGDVTPLMIAARRGHEAVVRLLLGGKISIHKHVIVHVIGFPTDWTALKFAAWRGIM
jgi:hypothetical protein